MGETKSAIFRLGFVNYYQGPKKVGSIWQSRGEGEKQPLVFSTSFMEKNFCDEIFFWAEGMKVVKIILVPEDCQ